MHYCKIKGILSASNGMNLYRGCQHGCIYCDARSKCYGINHLFEDIEIKENSLELLEEALKKKKHSVVVSTGAMSDPYIPLEKELLYTRRALEIIAKYNCGLNIQTKSSLILRDLDLLIEINKKNKCIVNITMTTYDEELCCKLEPNVSTTKERFYVLEVLKKHQIPTIVWISPILPFINDTKENLLGLLEYCRKANVYGIVCFDLGLTLREGNREYFYRMLDRHFPGLKETYQKKYGLEYVLLSDNHQELMDLLRDFCAKYHIVCDQEFLFRYMHETEDKISQQLSLF